MSIAFPTTSIDAYLRTEFADLDDPKTALLALSKDPVSMSAIAEALKRLPTQDPLVQGDSRELSVPNR